jgi:hypothetical protein
LKDFLRPFFLFRLQSARILLLVALMAGLAIPDLASAQTGGRKREGGVKRKTKFSLFNRNKSKGHADEFARGNSGRRTFWSKLFRKDRPAWQYRKTGSVRTNHKENRFLFFRHRSKGREENAMTQDRQSRTRSRNREHGNRVFRFKKYKRK